jgi:hypothetical protein
LFSTSLGSQVYQSIREQSGDQYGKTIVWVKFALTHTGCTN